MTPGQPRHHFRYPDRRRGHNDAISGTQIGSVQHNDAIPGIQIDAGDTTMPFPVPDWLRATQRRHFRYPDRRRGYPPPGREALESERGRAENLGGPHGTIDKGRDRAADGVGDGAEEFGLFIAERSIRHHGMSGGEE